MRGKPIIISIVLILFLFSFIQVAPSKVEAIGEPEVTISFLEDEEEQVADVRPGEHGTVTFPGTVEADIVGGSSVQDVIVRLSGSTNLDWPVAINPDEVQINPGNVAHFSATVTVPPESSVDISDKITISGTAETIPGSGEQYQVPPIIGTIKIAQFYKFSLSANNVMQKGSLGDVVTVNLFIENHGNGADTFDVFVVNIAKLEKKGFSVSPVSTTASVKEKSSIELSFNVELPTERKNAGTHAIEIEVHSKTQELNEGTAFPKTYPFEIRVESSPWDFFTSTNIIIIITIIVLIGIVYYLKKRNEIK
jgi:hypothetical protein